VATMERLHELGRTEPPSAEQLGAIRDRLLVEARGHRSVPSHRPHRRRRTVASIAALALVTTGSAAFAAARLSSSRASANTTIECGIDTYIPVESANPVLDCYDTLARSGGQVPPLTGWISTSGMVEVLPIGTRPSAGSVPLPARFQVDPGIRYVTDVLGDATGPLLEGCLAPPSAVAYVQGQLAIAALTGWTVSVQPATGSCDDYFAAIDAATSTVVLSGAAAPSSQGSGGDVELRLARLLTSQMVVGADARCLDAATAITTATHDATALGIASNVIGVSDGGVIGPAGPRCATPFVEPAGFVDVVIWMAPRP
jgi:hypothetical protein